MRTASTGNRGAVVRAMVVGVAALGVLAGCSTSVDGEPAAQGESGESAGEETVQWNPCTELPDEALQATKVDPASKATVTDAPTGATTFRICRWDSTEGPYLVYVGSTTYTQAEARSNPNLTGLRDVQIGDRAGLIYSEKSDEDRATCWVNIPWAQGTFEVSVGWFYGEEDSMPETPPCSVAVRHATELEPYLPK
ncbi:DUF3558 domain-containing protein [Nocardia cyriacigeorgica]|uniref:DUF3558 domain-containing protein n=1 Tax=Nocardia cyriacigeorgica TaxID=135487 RepID=UPI00245894F2|nr:DUF3558 domain-containing protein [Nocardia cyriacigeorgica]